MNGLVIDTNISDNDDGSDDEDQPMLAGHESSRVKRFKAGQGQSVAVSRGKVSVRGGTFRYLESAAHVKPGPSTLEISQLPPSQRLRSSGVAPSLI